MLWLVLAMWQEVFVVSLIARLYWLVRIIMDAIKTEVIDLINLTIILFSYLLCAIGDII